MAESSVLIWKLKIKSDVDCHLQTSLHSLDHEIQCLEKIVEDTSQDIQRLSSMETKMNSFFSGIANLDKNDPKLLPFWDKINKAFSQDMMQEHGNIQQNLMEQANEKLFFFKEETKKKISIELYTPESLESDISSLLSSISQIINQQVATLCGHFLSEAYFSEVLLVHQKTETMRVKLLEVLHRDIFEKSSDSDRAMALPRLTSPKLEMMMKIPFGEFPWYKELLRKLNEVLGGIPPEDFVRRTFSPNSQREEQNEPVLSEQRISIYGNWTSELNTLHTRLLDDIFHIINKFFIEKDETVFMKYFQAYVNEAKKMLEIFKSTMRNEIDQFEKQMEETNNVHKKASERLTLMQSHRRDVKSMQDHFKQDIKCL